MGKKSRRPKKSASKKAADNRVSLLCGPGMSPELIKALDVVFQRFDTDGDGRLSLEELQSFARACNDGNAFDEMELDQLREFFATDEVGQLTREGFHQLYHTQTTARPLDTWKDLHALGFDDQLQCTLRPIEPQPLDAATCASEGAAERDEQGERDSRVTCEKGNVVGTPAAETNRSSAPVGEARSKDPEDDITLRADVAAFLKDFNYDTDSDISEPEGLDDIDA